MSDGAGDFGTGGIGRFGRSAKPAKPANYARPLFLSYALHKKPTVSNNFHIAEFRSFCSLRKVDSKDLESHAKFKVWFPYLG
jgi:hypothetical protein